MLESQGDIFKQTDADAICFTSNGILKKNSSLVMGAGIAKAFADRWSVLPSLFGAFVKSNGNVVGHVHVPVDATMRRHVWVCSFPTKNHWRENSSIELISHSATQLATLATAHRWTKIYLTRPGCGLGGLQWSDVKTVIAPLLDDRFTVLVP